jgi:hypothetical protein
MGTPEVIVAGFSDDVAQVLACLPAETRCFIVNESMPDDSVLPPADTVLYLFSTDTGYSSKFLSWFSWIHDHARPRKEFLVGLGGADVKRMAFDFLKGLPVISPEEAKTVL